MGTRSILRSSLPYKTAAVIFPFTDCFLAWSRLHKYRPQGLKPARILEPYAALKRRTSTSPLAFVGLSANCKLPQTVKPYQADLRTVFHLMPRPSRAELL